MGKISNTTVLTWMQTIILCLTQQLFTIGNRSQSTKGIDNLIFISLGTVIDALSWEEGERLCRFFLLKQELSSFMAEIIVFYDLYDYIRTVTPLKHWYFNKLLINISFETLNLIFVSNFCLFVVLNKLRFKVHSIN